MNPIDALMETATPLQRRLLEGCRYVEETGCWEWLSAWGIYDPVTLNNASSRNVSFREFVGPLHGADSAVPQCGNRKCINPAHLGAKEQMEKGYWTKERCAEEALKYKSFAQFRAGNSSAYSIAGKNEWIDEICSHMTRLRRPNNYWTKEQCAKAAKNFKALGAFQRESRSAYTTAFRNGWLDDICSHMVRATKPSGYWTKATCANEARNFTTRNEFKLGSYSAYCISRRNKWLDEICSHMVSGAIKWNYSACLNEASKYHSRREMYKGNESAYKAARKNGWLDEFFPKPA